MTTKDFIKKLNSKDSSESVKAIEYFDNLFYNDLSISDDNYVSLIKTITDKLLDPNDKDDKTDLFGIVSSSFYTNKPEGIISHNAFKEAIEYLSESNDPLFGEILQPFLQQPKLKPIILDYYSRIKKTVPNIK